MKQNLILLALFTFLFSCEKAYFVEEDEVLASAYNDILLKSELDQLFKSHRDVDSSFYYQSYINNWLLKKAINYKSTQLPYVNKVDSLVYNYRTQLNDYYYHLYFVNNYLDTIISYAQYDSLYQELKKVRFQLIEPIIKGLILKVDKEDISANKLVENSYLLTDSLQEVNLMTNLKYEVSYYYYDTINYIKLKDLNKEININNLNFKSRNYAFKLEDDNYNYYFNKIVYKNQGYYPVQIVKNELKEIILKDRKEKLIIKANNQLLKQELANGNLKSILAE